MKRKLTALLLAVWLLAGIAQPTAWASGGEITISSAKELVEFSKNCSPDTWSQGKTFRLPADINLAGAGFAPIPTFGGTFRGEGHTISGVRVSASGSNMGFFRYLQKGAVVQELHVAGTVAPGGSHSTVGGIAELVSDGENGYKIDIAQLDEIEKRIREILSDESAYTHLANNALHRARRAFVDAPLFDNIFY